MKLLLSFVLLCSVFQLNEVSAQVDFTEAELSAAKLWVASVDETRSVDELVVASLLAEAHQLNVDHRKFLEFALKKRTTSSLVYEVAISACDETEQWSYCSKKVFMDTLIRLSPDNANTYLFLAAMKYEAGLKSEALEAIQKAVDAPYFKDSFFIFSKRVLDVLSSFSYPKTSIRFRATQYFGAGWGAFSSYGRLSSLCRAEAEKDRTWRDKCLSIGEKIANSGSTFFSTRIGLAIRKATLLGSSSSPGQIAEVDRLRSVTHYWRVYALDKLDFLSGEGVPDYPAPFFEHAVSAGEIDAISNALTELEK